MEKMVKERLEWWIENNNLLTSNQAGFRKNRSTEEQIGRMIQIINDGFQQKPALKSMMILVDSSPEHTTKYGIMDYSSK